MGLCLGATIGGSKALVPLRIESDIDDTQFIDRKRKRTLFQSGLHALFNEFTEVFLRSTPSERNQRQFRQARHQVPVKVLLRCLRIEFWCLEFVGGDEESSCVLPRPIDVTVI
jgi:hypothetical protein